MESNLEPVVVKPKRRRASLHEVIEKERRVLELRLAHVKWEDIAQAVGYASKGAAYNAYERALKRTLQEPADEIRTQERERLDRLAQYWFPRALNKNDADAAQQASLMVLKIMDRRAKYLGLDENKVKHDVTIYEGGSEIDQRVKELAHLVARNRTDASRLDGSISPTMA